MIDKSKTESLTVSGVAHNVILADTMAWAGLEAVLGGDPIAGWFLKVMQHALVPPGRTQDAKHAVEFQATFYRIPENEMDEVLV